MGKITGLEDVKDIPSKVLLMYEAVEQLIGEGVDINDIRVSTITDRAGIGKGTAYDYFDTKEDILACAVIFYIRKIVKKLEDVLASKNCFAEQVTMLLEEIENGSDKQHCFMRYIHVMTDKSNFSKLVQQKAHMEDTKRCLLAGVFFTMLEKGVERGDIRNDLPMDYMVYVLFSKIISYMMCVCEESFVGVNADKLRPYVYQSILDELCVPARS